MVSRVRTVIALGTVRDDTGMVCGVVGSFPVAWREIATIE